ncbi:hypothetical protein ACR77V_12565 [Staphylococcus epidermidis]|uniref:hypothetical protein n=1 Tax=Staphylococcus epidermidis TaxID=1282 RepID=UPI003DA301C6
MPSMEESLEFSRVDQLRSLLMILAQEIDSEPGARDLAQLSKQYRETLREIEEIEGVTEDDEISDILSERAAAGKPGAVRKNRS